MDNFTHSLTGWALGQTGLKTKTRKGLAALILSANMPDIDVFFGWAPWAPLATHRGFTHGVLGALIIMPAILVCLLWSLDRWQCRRGVVFRSGLSMDLPWLIGLSCLGALTHPLLDLQTTYSVQLLSPFSTSWFHTETLFIIDVVIWTVLPFAIWLSRRRERHGGAWRRPATIALIAMCGYIAFNGAISLAARNSLIAHLGRQPVIFYARQEPVLFWKRDLVWREGGSIGQARYDPLRSLTTLYEVQPMVRDNIDDPLTRRAIKAAPGLLSFIRWSTLPMATIRKHKCEASVELADARFLPIPANDRTSSSARPFGQQPPIILPMHGPGC